jgi:putative heme-binding domain-containing protein
MIKFRPILPSPKSLCLLLAAAALGIWGGFAAAAQAPQQKVERRTARPLPTQGKQTFASNCASCHGLDGRGGERAPNIADSPKVQALSAAQIQHIIENGVPGTGMPAFHSLDSSQIAAVVAYLRTLQGAKKTVKLPGDPERGQKLFFGKAGCSGCHMISGQGGFIASDLSGYARTHEPEQMRGAIVQSDASNHRQVRLATATVHGGSKYVGRVRNEDNFSVQLQGLDGTFYLLSKSDLEGLDYSAQTLMPSDYGSTLSAGELNDVVSYLIRSADSGSAETQGKTNEEE